MYTGKTFNDSNEGKISFDNKKIREGTGKQVQEKGKKFGKKKTGKKHEKSKKKQGGTQQANHTKQTQQTPQGKDEKQSHGLGLGYAIIDITDLEWLDRSVDLVGILLQEQDRALGSVEWRVRRPEAVADITQQS